MVLYFFVCDICGNQSQDSAQMACLDVRKRLDDRADFTADICPDCLKWLKDEIKNRSQTIKNHR